MSVEAARAAAVSAVAAMAAAIAAAAMDAAAIVAAAMVAAAMATAAMVATAMAAAIVAAAMAEGGSGGETDIAREGGGKMLYAELLYKCCCPGRWLMEDGSGADR